MAIDVGMFAEGRRSSLRAAGKRQIKTSGDGFGESCPFSAEAPVEEFRDGVIALQCADGLKGKTVSEPLVSMLREHEG